MKANELRVGNYVFLNDLVERVISIIGNDGCFIGNELSKPFEDFAKLGLYGLLNETFLVSQVSPIEISEKRLSHFGFIKCDSGKQVANVAYSHKGTGEELFIYKAHQLYENETDSEWFFDGIANNPKIKYIHQLQNLFFALYGEELVLN
jgi:hypothetical protein